MVTLGREPSVVLSRVVLDQLGDEVVETLGRRHRERPLEAGIPREELRSRVFANAPGASFERVLEELGSAGRVRLAPDVIALASHEVRLSAGEEEVRELLLSDAGAAGLAGVDVPAAAERSGRDVGLLDRVARVLVREGLLERVGRGLLVHRETLDTLKKDVLLRWPPGSRLDVGGFKELTGLSRKYVIPLLEYLDRERVTRRAGNDRLILGR
jgi:selenocysteine-specific elongation factor